MLILDLQKYKKYIFIVLYKKKNGNTAVWILYPLFLHWQYYKTTYVLHNLSRLNISLVKCPKHRFKLNLIVIYHIGIRASSVELVKRWNGAYVSMAEQLAFKLFCQFKENFKCHNCKLLLSFNPTNVQKRAPKLLDVWIFSWEAVKEEETIQLMVIFRCKCCFFMYI